MEGVPTHVLLGKKRERDTKQIIKDIITITLYSPDLYRVLQKICTAVSAVHGVAEGRTQLSDFTLAFHFHALEKEMATHSSVLA